MQPITTVLITLFLFNNFLYANLPTSNAIEKQANKDYRQYKKSLDKYQKNLAQLKQDLAAGKPGVSQEDINELSELVSDMKVVMRIWIVPKKLIF
jgi:hypothetical protein